MRRFLFEVQVTGTDAVAREVVEEALRNVLANSTAREAVEEGLWNAMNDYVGEDNCDGDILLEQQIEVADTTVERLELVPYCNTRSGLYAADAIRYTCDDCGDEFNGETDCLKHANKYDHRDFTDIDGEPYSPYSDPELEE